MKEILLDIITKMNPISKEFAQTVHFISEAYHTDFYITLYNDWSLRGRWMDPFYNKQDKKDIINFLKGLK